MPGQFLAHTKGFPSTDLKRLGHCQGAGLAGALLPNQPANSLEEAPARCCRGASPSLWEQLQATPSYSRPQGAPLVSFSSTGHEDSEEREGPALTLGKTGGRPSRSLDPQTPKAQKSGFLGSASASPYLVLQGWSQTGIASLLQGIHEPRDQPCRLQAGGLLPHPDFPSGSRQDPPPGPAPASHLLF